MISYESYKVLHLVAVTMLFGALGGAAVLAMGGGAPAGAPVRRVIALLHGAALLVALVAGFGLVARLDLASGGLPLWVWGKLVVWLLAGGLLPLSYRKPAWARPLLVVALPLLAAIAAFLAVFKPGD